MIERRVGYLARPTQPERVPDPSGVACARAEAATATPADMPPGRHEASEVGLVLSVGS